MHNMSITEIVENYGKMVSSICSRMISNPSTAEDAAQEVYLQIINSLPNYNGESSISTWIYSLTKNVVLNFARNEKKYSTEYLSSFFREDANDLEIPDLSTERYILAKQQCDRCLVGVLHCLDNDTRLAYILRDIAGLEYSEIANIFEKQENTVRKSISRAREKLRNFLNKECYLYNPNGKCKCRRKELVIATNLLSEYEKIRKTVNKVNIFSESESILPRKNYWLKFLK